MRVELLFVGILIFIIGFSTASLFSEVEKRTALGGSADRDNPSDFISADEIHLYPDKMVIEKEGLKYAAVEDTKSMEPLLSANSHTIETKPDIEKLGEGDIITFYNPELEKTIVHSIVETGTDDEGWYARTKGYNTDFVDEWKVRFTDIKGVVIGVLN
jgi:hypothetical protein